MSEYGYEEDAVLTGVTFNVGSASTALSRVCAINADGVLTASAVTTDEAGLLAGMDAPIQDKLNNIAPSNDAVMTGIPVILGATFGEIVATTVGPSTSIIQTISVADGKAYLFYSMATAREIAATSAVASYIRESLFYRDGGVVITQGNAAELLSESKTYFNYQAASSGNNIVIRAGVAAASGRTVNWRVDYFYIVASST